MDVPVDARDEADIDEAVLDDVDDIGIGISTLSLISVEHLLLGICELPGAGGDHSQVGMVLGEERDHDLAHQHGDGGRDMRIGTRELQPQGILVAVLPHRDVREIDHRAARQVTVILEVDVACRRDGARIADLPDLDPGDRAGVADDLFLGPAVHAVGPELAVIAPAREMVCCTAEHDARVLRDGHDLVVLPLHDDELARQVRLVHMPVQPGTEKQLGAIGHLGHDRDIPEAREALIVLREIRDAIMAPDLDLPGRGIVFLRLLHDHMALRILVRIVVDELQMLDQEAFERLLHIGDGKADILEALPQLLLAHHPARLHHRHNDGEDGIALTLGEVRRYGRDRLGVVLEDLPVLCHIGAQEIVRCKDVHEGLLRAPRGELAERLEHVLVFIFGDDEGILALAQRPGIRAEVDMLVELELLLWKLGEAQELGIVLAIDPALVGKGHSRPRGPGYLRDLRLEGHEGDLGADAEVVRDARQQPVLELLAVDLPEHADRRAFRCLGRADLGEVRPERMGQGIDQAIGILVEDAVVHRAAIRDILGEEVQADLAGGDEARGIDHEDHAHA